MREETARILLKKDFTLRVHVLAVLKEWDKKTVDTPKLQKALNALEKEFYK